jgi:threonine/homoserine/homoserine lactone efflux protein
MLPFIIAVTLLMLTPGPAILMVINLGINYGFKSGIRFVLGVIIGANIVVLSVILGLASVILTYPTLRLILLILSSAYLIYLAINILRQNSSSTLQRTTRKLNIFDGILLQLVNPKNYIVQITLFSGFLIWPNDLTLEMVFKILAANLIWLPGHFAWLGLGVLINTLDLSPKTLKYINLLMATLLISVIILAILNY